MSRTKSKKAVLDIVITTAGRFDMLEMCLNSIYSTVEVPYTITIVDDNSPKDEKSDHKDLFVVNKEKDRYNNVVDFRTKRFDSMQGFPMSANTGAKQGNSDLILFISDDVVLQEGTVRSLLGRMDEQDIGICGTKLLFPLTSTHPNRPAGKVQHVGLALDIHANPVHPLVGWSSDNPKCNKSRDCFAVTGACFMVRRRIFTQVGGFDLMYGKGTYEDVDLCMKVRQAGHRIFIDTDAKAYHYVGATVEKQQQAYPLQGNNMLYKAKWAKSGMFVYDDWTYR